MQVADEPYDGTECMRERTSGKLQTFCEGLGAQLSAAPEVELEFVGTDRRHGRPVSPWRLVIEAVRHDPAPSWKKEGQPRQELHGQVSRTKALESEINLILRARLFQFDVVTSDFVFHL
jgi:hypothetical protein